MFPLGDDNRGRRIVPVATYALVALNVAVFVLEIMQPDVEAFIEQWGVIPARITGGEGFLTLLTSMFLHGGFAHLLGNMLFLWIFGDNVEDAFGSALFLAFYLLCGLAATWAQIFLGPDSTVPMVGASGAISGVLAAYIVMFGTNRVRVLLGGLLMTTVPAFVMIGMWIVIQVINGFGSLAETQQTGGVAYAAHVGGFVAGLLLTFLMRPLAQAGVNRRRF